MLLKRVLCSIWQSSLVKAFIKQITWEHTADLIFVGTSISLLLLGFALQDTDGSYLLIWKNFLGSLSKSNGFYDHYATSISVISTTISTDNDAAIDVPYLPGLLYLFLCLIYFISFGYFKSQLGKNRSSLTSTQWKIWAALNLSISLLSSSAYWMLIHRSFDIPTYTIPVIHRTSEPFIRDPKSFSLPQSALTLKMDGPLFISTSDPKLPNPEIHLSSPIRPQFLRPCILHESLDRDFKEPGIYLVSYTAECGPASSNTVTRVIQVLPRLKPTFVSARNGFRTIQLQFPRSIVSKRDLLLGKSIMSSSRRFSLKKANRWAMECYRQSQGNQQAWEDDLLDSDDEEEELQSSSSSSRRINSKKELLRIDAFAAWVELQKENSEFTPLHVFKIESFKENNVELTLSDLPESWNQGDTLVLRPNPKACFDSTYPFEPCSEEPVRVALPSPIAVEAHLLKTASYLQVRLTFSDLVLSFKAEDGVMDITDGDDDDELDLSDSRMVKAPLHLDMFSARHITPESNHTIPILKFEKITTKTENQTASYSLTLDLLSTDVDSRDAILVLFHERLVGVSPPHLTVSTRQLLLPLSRGFCCEEKECEEVASWPACQPQLASVSEVENEKEEFEEMPNSYESQTKALTIVYLDEVDSISHLNLDRPVHKTKPGVYLTLDKKSVVFVKERVLVKSYGFSKGADVVTLIFTGPISRNTSFWLEGEKQLESLPSTDATHVDLLLDESPKESFLILIQDCKEAVQPFGNCASQEIPIQPLTPLRILEWNIYLNGTGLLSLSHPVQSWNFTEVSPSDIEINESHQDPQCNLPVLKSRSIFKEPHHNCSAEARHHKIPILSVDRVEWPNPNTYRITTPAYNRTEDETWSGSIRVRDTRFPSEKLVLFDWITPVLEINESGEREFEAQIEFSIFKTMLLGSVTFAYIFIGGCLLSLVHYLFDLSIEEIQKVRKSHVIEI